MQKATFAGGCFWCTEAIFKKIRGVKEVVSGYVGEKPSFRLFNKGEVNHVEATQLIFDPKKISYDDLLYIFFRTHDPTTKDRQGADVGPQYRSMVLYHDEKQKAAAEKAIKESQKEYKNPIVTEIEKFEKFYEAEGYHQKYYEKNKGNRYCRLVIDPKIQKLQKNFKDYLKN